MATGAALHCRTANVLLRLFVLGIGDHGLVVPRVHLAPEKKKTCIERIGEQVVGARAREFPTAALVSPPSGETPFFVENPVNLSDSMRSTDEELPGTLDRLEALRVWLNSVLVGIVEVAFWCTKRCPAFLDFAQRATFDALLKIQDELVGGAGLDSEE